jgi:hypothetical protein
LYRKCKTVEENNYEEWTLAEAHGRVSSVAVHEQSAPASSVQPENSAVTVNISQEHDTKAISHTHSASPDIPSQPKKQTMIAHGASATQQPLHETTILHKHCVHSYFAKALQQLLIDFSLLNQPHQAENLALCSTNIIRVTHMSILLWFVTNIFFGKP